MNNQNEIKVTDMIKREHKIISMNDGSVTLVTKLNDGTAHIFERISMQKALDYIACYESLELVRKGAEVMNELYSGLVVLFVVSIFIGLLFIGSIGPLLLILK